MGLNLNDKKAVVAEVSAQIAEAQTIVLAEYRGIQVGDMTQLRAAARENGVYMRVLKNTLARRAVEGTAFADLASEMTGPLVYSISKDAVAAAKVVQDFAKRNDSLVIRAEVMRAKCSIKPVSLHWQAFRAVKFCFLNLWALCWLQSRVLPVGWLRWQPRKKPKLPPDRGGSAVLFVVYLQLLVPIIVFNKRIRSFTWQ